MQIFRQYKLLLPLIVCTLITVGLGIALLAMGGDNDPPHRETESVTETEETEVITVETPFFKTDLSAYERYIDVPSGSFLTLVNKTQTIDGNYDPGELVRIKDARRDIDLQLNAAKAMEAMFIEMRAAGIDDTFVTSGYRSYSYQTGLFNTYIQEEKSKDPTLTDEEARAKVLRYSAYPGTSEHHTGLAADLMTNDMRELDESFANYAVFAWLRENAWKFGFILRFPSDKVEITGYDYEPWHYRFVGRYDAYMIQKDNLCLEEYVAQYRK